MHTDYLKYVSHFPNIQDFSSYPIAVAFKFNCFWSEKTTHMVFILKLACGPGMR